LNTVASALRAERAVVGGDASQARTHGSLGLAARFVSGYLCSRSLAGDGTGLVDGGETHAYVQVYLPGTGWIEFDPVEVNLTPG
jgi:hypothetical protein